MTYPARLVFDLTDDDEKAAAVVQAALDLQLPFEMDGPQKQIVVVVDSAMKVYQFGFRTQQLLLKQRLSVSAPKLVSWGDKREKAD